MAAHYNAPSEVRPLEKLINQFGHKHGLPHMTVFRDFLRYVINRWTIPGYPGYDDWKYTQTQNKEFMDMNYAWIQIMDEQIKKHDFYDVFARLHPSYLSRKEAQSKGQFMTPPHVAKLMSEMTIDQKEKKEFKKVCDPAGGSGGLMLAAHAQNHYSYYVSWDLDYTMCLQAVCNFLIHGVVGAVVCVNTLSLHNFQGAWLVNEFLHRTGLPSIRPLTEQEYHLHDNSNRQWVYFLSQEEYDKTERTFKLLDMMNKMFNENDTDKGTTDNG